MERTRKTWGEKWTIFQNDLCEVSVLYLRPKQRCSWHDHRSKYNLFFTIEGHLRIKLDDGVSVGISEVGKNQIFTTRPGEWHEFQTAEEETIIIEIMFVKYDPEDIIRDKVGGPIK